MRSLKMMLEIYLAISVVAFVLQAFANRNFIKETIFSNIDYAEMECGFAFPWEAPIYIGLASMGSLLAFSIIFALKAIVWWYFIPHVIAQVLKARRRETQHAEQARQSQSPS